MVRYQWRAATDGGDGMTDEQAYMIGNMMSRQDRMAGQLNDIWKVLDRWDTEQARDQAALRTMLAVIAIILVALGAGIVWSEERARGRVEARIQAAELRIERLESAVAGGD